MAAPTEYYRDALFFFGKETTAGTKQNVAAAGYVKNVDRDSVNFQIAGPAVAGIPHNAIRQHVDGPGAIPSSASYYELGLSMKVYQMNELAAAPEVGALLAASGFTETDDAGGFTYTPSADPNAGNSLVSLTLRREQTANGNIYESHGVRGGVSFNYDQANGLVATFNGIGAYNPPTAQSSLTTVAETDYPSSSICVNPVTFQFFGAAIKARDFSFDTGYAVETVEHVSNSTNYHFLWPGILTRPARKTTGRFSTVLDKAKIVSTFGQIIGKETSVAQVAFSGTNSTGLIIDFGQVRVTGLSSTEVSNARVEWTVNFEAVANPDTGTPSTRLTFVHAT